MWFPSTRTRFPRTTAFPVSCRRRGSTKRARSDLSRTRSCSRVPSTLASSKFVSRAKDLAHTGEKIEHELTLPRVFFFPLHFACPFFQDADGYQLKLIDPYNAPELRVRTPAGDDEQVFTVRAPRLVQPSVGNTSRCVSKTDVLEPLTDLVRQFGNDDPYASELSESLLSDSFRHLRAVN